MQQLRGLPLHCAPPPRFCQENLYVAHRRLADVPLLQDNIHLIEAERGPGMLHLSDIIRTALARAGFDVAPRQYDKARGSKSDTRQAQAGLTYAVPCDSCSMWCSGEPVSDKINLLVNVRVQCLV